ncbi:peptidase, S8/S53 family [Leptospira inadai serovar Lyme str. 10]|uniref:Peptidase, S8/S53 family n=1 Tax=Leptospira inadai serovar Lyme str. 10 TaxID=1049790 RepID=V6HLX3_9LEPT|nr:peptidase, S8/S53 family [Leptospira inadai serovar Lyme str. 10]
MHSAFLSCLLILFVLGGDCPPKDNTGSAKAIRILFSPETKNDRFEHDLGRLTTSYWIDANGDGVEDLCSKTTNIDLSTTLSCHTNYYGKFSKLFDIGSSSYDQLLLVKPQFTDVTGDGIPDYCGLDFHVSGVNGYYSVRCVSIIENKKGEYSTGGIIEGSLSRGFEPSKFDLYWGDINGDKRSDYCSVENVGLGYQLACQISSGTGFVPKSTAKLNFTSETAKITFPSFADIDGDTDKDFTWIEEANGRIRILFMKNEGGKFGSQVASDPIGAGLKADDPSTVRWWTDWNGDGKSDFCYASDSNTIQCLSSTGNGFASAVKSESMELGVGTSRGWIDANNDGKTDFCRRVMSGGSGYYYICTLSQGSSFGGVNEPGSYKSDLYTDPEMLLGESMVQNEKWIQPTGETGYPMHCAVQGLLDKAVCQLVRKEGSPLVDQDECPLDEELSREKRSSGYKNSGAVAAACAALWYRTAMHMDVGVYKLAKKYKRKDVYVTVVDHKVFIMDGSLKKFKRDYNENTPVAEINSFFSSNPVHLTHGSQVASVIYDYEFGQAPGTKIGIREKIMNTATHSHADTWRKIYDDILNDQDPIVVVTGSIRRTPDSNFDDRIDAIGVQNKSLIVSAAGNSNPEGKSMNDHCISFEMPACYFPNDPVRKNRDPVIRVAALSQYDPNRPEYGIIELFFSSNFGSDRVDIAAPGERIDVRGPFFRTPYDDGNPSPDEWHNHVSSGTSFATPIVAAVLATMKSCQPKATAQQLKQGLLDNADVVEGLKTQVINGRVLNAQRAIQAFCIREEL